jgi:hypothetical protein
MSVGDRDDNQKGFEKMEEITAWKVNDPITGEDRLFGGEYAARLYEFKLKIAQLYRDNRVVFPTYPEDFAQILFKNPDIIMELIKTYCIEDKKE